MQVNPQEKIGLTALISDPSDTTPYFVRCVMRDSQTNTVLGSVKLTQDPANTRRYFGYIEAPSNNTPTGRHINITTSIYTDSGYSVYSPNYQEVLEKLVVAVRWTLAYGGGGGDLFGTTPDYSKQVRAAVKDTIEPVFGRLSKLLNGSRKNAKTVADPESEKRIISAVRAAGKAQGIPDKLATLAETIETLLEKVEGLADSPVVTKDELTKATSALQEASETLYQSVIHASLLGTEITPAESLKDLPLEKASAGKLMKEGTGARMPSDGIIPLHVRARTKEALTKKGLATTA